MRHATYYSNRKPYGSCALCGIVGSIQNHHIIPKRYGIKTDIKTKFVYGDETGKLHNIKLKQRIERLMIELCDKCHKKMHPENWKFIMNKIAIDKEKQVSEDLNSKTN